MGEKLLKYYDLAKDIGGLNAQIKFAILTMIPSKKAAELPDYPEIINKFEESLEILKKEFKK